MRLRRSEDRGDAGRGKKRVRGAIGRTFMRVPLLRRWYVRRILKFIDKSKAKGRPLPEGMAETARFLSRVPKHQRAKAFEDAIEANQEVPKMGRQYRRAASRQRHSGKGETRFRPGLPPGALKQGRQRPR
ncbi:MAG: hypothetical protein ACRDZX_15600 [Acidimicrobiales bacterium]